MPSEFIMDKESVEQRAVLEINDFGPIKRAKIELQPLTVFVGPSNTGKSYLAVLIYALHRAIAGMAANHEFQRPLPGLEREMSESESSFINRIVSEIQSESELKSIDLEGDALTNFLYEVTNRSSGIISEIVRCCGLSGPANLKRKFSGEDAEIRLSLPTETLGKPLAKLFMEAEQGCRVEIFGPSRVSMEPLTYWEPYMRWRNTDGGLASDHAAKSSIGEKISKTAFEQVMEPMLASAYYLPANRSGIMNFHTLVVSGILGRAAPAGPHAKANAPMLSGVLSDFLQELLAVRKFDPTRGNSKSHSDGQSDIQHIATCIESAVLGGSIEIDEAPFIKYPDFHYKPKSWRVPLPLMNASSMVSELAPLVLYLRGMVDVGETIIIEEPESHLHPKMQIRLMEIIAAIVNVGIKVVVTTHSEWIISCLDNIVLRSRRQLTDDETSYDGYPIALAEPSLQESQVGVWTFSQSGVKSGSIVERLEFAGSDGYSPDYEDDLIDLHNEWAEYASDW